MSAVCILLVFLWGGWEHEVVGTDEDTTGFRGLTAGEGRNDGMIRLYAGSDEKAAYEFSYVEGEWQREFLARQGTAHGVHVGQPRNDGLNRVYFSTCTLTTLPEMVEYTYGQNGWERSYVNTYIDETYDCPIGAGRNDGKLRLYAGTLGGDCFEITFQDGVWEKTPMGGFAVDPREQAQQTVWVGEGRNDGVTRVYASCNDGKVWEFSYEDDRWTQEIVDTVLDAWTVCVAQGRNDGVNRLYVTAGIPQNTPGKVYEYTWEGGEWSRTEIGETENVIWGLAIGKGRNDGLNRVYAGTRKGDLYEYTWQGSSWQAYYCGNISSWGYIHDMVIARGRNDDTLRLYAAAGDGKIHEMTFRPETGILVYPSDSAVTDPGVPVIYDMWVKNTGKQLDTLELEPLGTLSGWSAEITDSNGDSFPDSDADGKVEAGAVASGDSVSFKVRITPSASATGGTRDSTRIRGTTTRTPTASSQAYLLTEIAQAADIEVEPDQQGSVRDGESIDYIINIHNRSRNEDLVDLRTRGPLSGWDADLLDATGAPVTDSDSDGRPDVGPLEAYTGQTSLILRLTPPQGESNGTTDTSYVIGVSDLDTQVADSANLITVVTNPQLSVTVEPDTAGSGFEGEVTYPMRVINTSAEPDSFTLWTASNLDWQAELRHQGEPITHTGFMAAGQTLFVDLAVTLPEDVGSITGPPDFANTERRKLWAQSLTESSVSDSAAITTRVIPPLDIHNFPNPFTGETTFIYSIPEDGKATLSIYTRAGEHVITLFENEIHQPGIYTAPWEGINSSGRDLAPGIYVYSLRFMPDEGTVRKIVKKALLQP